MMNDETTVSKQRANDIISARQHCREVVLALAHNYGSLWEKASSLYEELCNEERKVMNP